MPTPTDLGSPARSAPQPLRVLVVDDDSVALEITSLLLAANGVRVERALGGQQALDTLQETLDTLQAGSKRGPETPASLPDVVLVDHQMPGIGGTVVGRYVKSLPEPRPRVIAMSASPLPEAELAAFDDFLSKPIDRDLLRAAIAGSRPVPGQPTPVALPVTLPPALDQSTVRKLQAIMPPHAIRELYTVYVADTRQRIDELERHSVSGDEESLRRCAHMLKGAAAMAGVPGVASIAAGLEAGRLPRHDHRRLFHQLRSACDDVERSMTHGEAPRETR